ncbi:hypothetical protein BU16DRAFT_475065 [Lophium mytilinum]|uniref:PX-associated-domain-containing protein n=1 Tax=Lophium mytilinum TaxID=390894 RepID=A0A6A6RDR8_9PEZI|nr:hypothetical protein BU16DRAFT_475065 [Lophium mytilinum]
MSSSTLSPAQAHALFDILTHNETYAEIENFKWPEAIDNYGHPFKKEDGVQTTSPLLQLLLNKFVLKIPGLKSVPLDFWQERCRTLVAKLAEAELSESYDKGAIGSRKTLATAISAILEYVARGCLGGYPQHARPGPDRKYDTSNADDVMQAWDDAMQEMIYGDLLDELFNKAAESERLEDHSSLVQAAHEYILINLASFLHHVFVLSPDGQYLLRVIENVHRLVPYTMVRQTLRVGNAATMINGMLKLVLTKLSVTAFTNWMGISKNADDGMNLLQQIVSTVMSWDNTEFQKRATQIEKGKDAPGKDQLKSVKAHVRAPRDERERLRSISIEQSKSIVTVILESSNPPLASDLPDTEHAYALEYYSTHLSIRDRDELTKILCRLQPDLLTQAIREVVAAYDPIIRAIHNAVDLSGSLSDLENFLTDLIKMSKPKKQTNSETASKDSHKSQSGEQLPSVEDYVTLLRKHMPSAHRFLHQIAKNGPKVTETYRNFAKEAAAEFRDPSPPVVADANASPPDSTPSEPAAGAMTAPLTAIFGTLSDGDQKDMLAVLASHAKYLSTLKSSSAARMKSIIANTSSTTYGPGMYLARWHALIDDTPITPATAKGPVRSGREVKGEMDRTSQKGADSGKSAEKLTASGEVPTAPDITFVVKKLGPYFKEVLTGMEIMG